MATPDAITVSLDAGWAVGAMFGGHLADLLADAAVTATGADLAPVSTSVAFLRPAFPGAATISTRVVRAGRRYTVVSCELAANGVPAATALVTLAPVTSLPFAVSADPVGLPPAPPVRVGDVADRVDWRAVTPWRSGPQPGSFESWFSLRDERLDAGRYLIASDLIGPAIAAAGHALPFRIATVALDVSVIALSDSAWLRQLVDVTVTGSEAIARLELRDPFGALLSTATHRVVILPAADEELPLSVTAFGWGR